MQTKTRMVLCVGSTVLALVLPRMAAASTWTNNAGDLQWSTAANWNGGVPNATDAVADFSTLVLSANPIITATGAVTVGKLFVGGSSAVSYAYTITNQNGLTFATSSGSAVLTHGVNAYLDTLSGSNITLSSPLAITNLSGTRTLTIAAPLSGSQPITVAGGAGVTLSATNSTFTNLLTLASGVLYCTPDTSDTVQGGLGPINNAVTLAAGATLACPIGVLSTGRTITVNGTQGSPSVIGAWNAGDNSLRTINSRITGPGWVSFYLPNTWGEGLYISNPGNDYAGGTFFSFGQSTFTVGANAQLGPGPVYVNIQNATANNALNFWGNSNLVYGSTYQPLITANGNTAMTYFRGAAPMLGSLSGPGPVSLGDDYGGNSGSSRPAVPSQPKAVQLTVGMDNGNATFSGSINEVLGSTTTTGTVVKAGTGKWYLTGGGSAYRGGLIVTNGAVFANAGTFTASTFSAYTVANSSAIVQTNSAWSQNITNGLTVGQPISCAAWNNVISAFTSPTNISTSIRPEGGTSRGLTFTASRCGPTGLGPVTVATNATLGGSGGIWGAVTVNGGTVSPGADVGVGGTLTVNSNVTFNPGSTLQINVNSSSSYGQLVVNGTLALTNTTISITGGTVLYNGLTVPIVSATTLITNNVTVTPGYRVNQVGTQLMLTAQLPTVANNGVAPAGPTTMYLSGTLLSTGTFQTTWGVIWGTNDPGPTLSGWLGGGTKTIGTAGSVPVTVTNLVRGLTTGTTYYFRYWAQNAGGTTVADPSITFKPIAAAGSYMPITFPGYTNRAENLVNFPALVVLSNNMASGFTFGSFVTTNGWDLRFVTTRGAANYLNYEIESWNTNAGQASYVWVQVPTILSNGASVIYAMWGDLNNSSQLPCTTNGATWSNGYVVVNHMNSTNGGKVADSTVNAYNGTLVNNPAKTTGMIGNGLSFSKPSSQYYTLPNLSSLNAANTATLTAWVKLNTATPTDGNATGFMTLGNTVAYDCYPWTDGSAYLNDLRNSRAGAVSLATGPTRTNWHMVAFTQSGGAWSFYQNVTLVQSAASGTTLALPASPAIGWSGSTYYMDGSIDELRLSSVARSTNWLWAEYMDLASNTAITAYSGVTVVSSKDPPIPGTTIIFR